jgi:hypothetical protein
MRSCHWLHYTVSCTTPSEYSPHIAACTPLRPSWHLNLWSDQQARTHNFALTSGYTLQIYNLQIFYRFIKNLFIIYNKILDLISFYRNIYIYILVKFWNIYIYIIYAGNLVITSKVVGTHRRGPMQGLHTYHHLLPFSLPSCDPSTLAKAKTRQRACTHLQYCSHRGVRRMWPWLGHLSFRDVKQVLEMSAKRFAGITIIAYYRGCRPCFSSGGRLGDAMEIKPFSFVAPASRMPESAERACATLIIHNLAKPADSCDPWLCTHLLGLSAGPCFPKHKSNLFCCLKLSSRKLRFATHDWAASRFPSLASVIPSL